jgi:hypothetical protein
LAALLLTASPALSSSMQSSRTVTVGEVRLRGWLDADAVLQDKLARAAAPSFVESDLKDSVADRPLNPESSRSGMADVKALPQPECQDFQSCSVPPLAMDVPAGQPIEPAILAMMRPWIWLADAKGARLGVAHADAGNQTLLAMNLQAFGLLGVELNVAPRPEGGVHLWFGRGFELAFVYSRERDGIKGVAALGR